MSNILEEQDKSQPYFADGLVYYISYIVYSNPLKSNILDYPINLYIYLIKDNLNSNICLGDMMLLRSLPYNVKFQSKV